MFAPEEMLDDPYPVYARLRRADAATFDEATGLWLIPGHADVDRLLRDRRLGRMFVPYEPQETLRPWNALNAEALLELEPPQHTRLRRLIAHPFTPRRISALRPRIVELADELLDAIDPMEFDLVTEYAELLPVAVIAELLGVPPSVRDQLRPWSNAIVALYELQHDPAAVAAAVSAAVEFTAALRELIAWRRAHPGDDLLSALVHADVDGQHLTVTELVATAALLLNAGHEASVNVIGNGMIALLDHPDELAWLSRNPEHADAAADELIRFDTPLSLFQRTVDTEIAVGDHTLPPGARVGLLLTSANRDERVFDDADVLDLRRRPNPHVGFGGGIHYCLGAPLARLEIGVAFARLLRRVPVPRLVTTPVRRPSFQFRGWSSIRLHDGRPGQMATRRVARRVDPLP